VTALLDPSIVPLLALLMWPLAKAIVFVVAATVSLFSRKAARRTEARRLLRMLSQGAEPPSQ
jgi:predicted lysophospholipase L1 biosynthesis ABC-type transport system permease subunit